MALQQTNLSCDDFLPSRSPKCPLKALICLTLTSIAYIIFASRSIATPKDLYYGYSSTDFGFIWEEDNDTSISSMEGTQNNNEVLDDQAAKNEVDERKEVQNITADRLSTEILELAEYRKKRGAEFYNWFEGNTTDKLVENADANGTVLDFAITGFAKCGTTSMEANLGKIAPMPIADVCTPVHQTVYYSYKNWPREYDNTTNRTKILRGSKCPRDVGWLDAFSTYLPKTLIIVGVRHPVFFYQSFWNMMMDFKNKQNRNKTPYDFLDHCREDDRHCNYECPGGQTLCLHRTRFHLPLARTGKTLLSNEERELLAPDDKDGGLKLNNHHIKNPIFLYELSEIKEDYMWNKLASLLKVPYIPHDIHEGSHKNRNAHTDRINICDPKYDDFRAMIMPNAYNMSIWFCDYLVPAAKNESQNMYLADPDRFCNIVKDYARDPCNRLVRLDNGTYTLRDNIDVIIKKKTDTKRW